MRVLVSAIITLSVTPHYMLGILIVIVIALEEEELACVYWILTNKGLYLLLFCNKLF